MRRGHQLVGKNAVVAFFQCEERRQLAAAQAPIERGSEVEYIRAHTHRQAFYLLGSDVIRRALDALLGCPNCTSLAKIDHLHLPGRA